MKTAFIALLLLVTVADAYSAQSITIPSGTTTYGPFSVNAIERRTDMTIVATTNAFTLMTIDFEYTPDKGSTWIRYGESVFLGGLPVPTPLGSFKRLPEGVTATHIRIITTLIGGDVTISAAPTVSMR